MRCQDGRNGGHVRYRYKKPGSLSHGLLKINTLTTGVAQLVERQHDA